MTLVLWHLPGRGERAQTSHHSNKYKNATIIIVIRAIIISVWELGYREVINYWALSNYVIAVEFMTPLTILCGNRR